MEGVHGAAGTAKSTARLVFTKALAAAALRCASAARGPGIGGRACTRPLRSARVRSSGLPAPSRDRVAACGLGPGGQEGQAASGQQGIWTEPAGEPRLPRAPGRVEAELPTGRSLFELEEA